MLSCVTTMTDRLVTRGPDHHAVWQDPEHPVVLGHRRLSILDLSEHGVQPMHSASGRYVLTYNGEIYNFKVLKTEIANRYAFKGNSDSEVLLACIEIWGVHKTLDKIKGMFAFAVWDRKAQALFLARDHLGKKPLYVGWAGSELIFASELKALCAHSEFNRDIDRAALTSYMRFSHVPAPLCIYKNVCQLLPGSFIALDMRMLKSGQELSPLIERFWNPKDVLKTARADLRGCDEQLIGDFDALLCECVADRMVSDVPLGAFLSGGIDSSTIVAIMQKQSAKKVKTYTIGFDEQEFNEAEHAKTIADHLGTEHHEMIFSAKDALDLVAKLPEIYDEPFADASALPTFLISQFAREHVTVALSGDGGDEMLGGYTRHITGPKAWHLINNHVPANLRKPFSQMIEAVPQRWWSALRPGKPHFGLHMHKFAPLLNKETPSDVYLSLVSAWSRPKYLVHGGREETLPLVDPQMQLQDMTFEETMMYWDVIGYLNGDILTKVDRASMAVSLEVRAPLLDQRIYDFVWRLPLEAKIRDGHGKWLLRQLLAQYVPEDLFNRPKQGFSVPIAQWLRTDLKDWAEDLLDPYEIKAQGLLDYQQLETMWRRHQKGKGNHAQALWTVLMFQAWYREWV